MKKNKQAYSLVELILVVLFVGIFAALAVPRINFAIIRKQKADTLSRRIVTDLRRTRTMAISDAANNSSGFKMKMTGPDPFTGYEIQNIDTSTTLDTLSIDSDVTVTNGSDFEFGPLGNLAGGDTQIDVSAEGRSFTITITAATGMVTCVEN